MSSPIVQIFGLILDALESDPALQARARALLGPPAAEPWLPLAVVAAEMGVRAHVLRDAGRRGELTIGKAGKTSMVKRSGVDKWIAFRPAAPGLAKTSAEDPRAEARASVSDAALRAAR